MKKNKEVVFYVVFIIFLLIILLNFGIHFVRTVNFNKKSRILTATQTCDNCSFFVHFRGGESDSWLKRNVNVDGKICTLKGATFDGDFCNDSDYDITDWKLRININQDCYLNNAWCGTVEVHQKDRVQTLDLRNFDKKTVILDGVYVDQDFMITLKKGDYIIYHPSIIDKENIISSNGGLSKTLTIGFIFYNDAAQEFNVTDYSAEFKFHKGYFQGTEPLIFIILLTIWFLILVAKIATDIAYKKAEKETARVRKMLENFVIQLSSLIGDRDPDTGGHVKRVSEIIKIIVEEFQKQNKNLLDDEKATDICRAAPMHDIGKISIDTSILCKPGKLTDEEFAEMKKHSTYSGDIVKRILTGVNEEPHFIDTAFNIARYHHERWDGRGYPDKISGENIPLEARILAIADVYDALVSKRCYKQSMSYDKAFEIMCEGMGSQFDPQMQSIIVACRQQLEDYYTNHQ